VGGDIRAKRNYEYILPLVHDSVQCLLRAKPQLGLHNFIFWSLSSANHCSAWGSLVEERGGGNRSRGAKLYQKVGVLRWKPPSVVQGRALVVGLEDKVLCRTE